MPDTGAMPHAQCYATLRISKPGVSSADVTARLGVAPTFAHEAGDVGRSGYVRREALWGLSSEHLGRGDLATHLTALLDQVAHCHDELDAMGSDGFNLDWFCFVDIVVFVVCSSSIDIWSKVARPMAFTSFSLFCLA